MKRSLLAAFAVVDLVLVCLAAPAMAGTITQSSRAAVVSAIGGSVIVETFTNFDNFDADTYTYCVISTGVLNAMTDIASTPGSCTGVKPGTVLAGATYSTSIGTGAFFNIDTSSYYAGGFLDSYTTNAPLTIAFDAAQTAFGFDTNRRIGGAFDISIQFASGTPYTAVVSVPGTGATTGFGFTSSLPDIVSVTITPAAGGSFAVDNVTFGEGVVLPEPGSMALLGGFLGAGLLARRRRA